MTENRQEVFGINAEAELKYWKRQHAAWEDEAGVGNGVEFDEEKFRPLADALARTDAGVGRRVLEGVIGRNNAVDSNRAVKTQSTQQTRFSGDNLEPSR